MTSYGCLYVITIDNPTPSFTTALYATHFLRMVGLVFQYFQYNLSFQKLIVKMILPD